MISELHVNCQMWNNELLASIGNLAYFCRLLVASMTGPSLSKTNFWGSYKNKQVSYETCSTEKHLVPNTINIQSPQEERMRGENKKEHHFDCCLVAYMAFFRLNCAVDENRSERWLSETIQRLMSSWKKNSKMSKQSFTIHLQPTPKGFPHRISTAWTSLTHICQ